MSLNNELINVFKFKVLIFKYPLKEEFTLSLRFRK